jgi:hypothetical protein
VSPRWAPRSHSPARPELGAPSVAQVGTVLPLDRSTTPRRSGSTKRRPGGHGAPIHPSSGRVVPKPTAVASAAACTPAADASDARASFRLATSEPSGIRAPRRPLLPPCPAASRRPRWFQRFRHWRYRIVGANRRGGRGRSDVRLPRSLVPTLSARSDPDRRYQRAPAWRRPLEPAPNRPAPRRSSRPAPRPPADADPRPGPG